MSVGPFTAALGAEIIVVIAILLLAAILTEAGVISTAVSTWGGQ